MNIFLRFSTFAVMVSLAMPLGVLAQIAGDGTAPIYDTPAGGASSPGAVPLLPPINSNTNTIILVSPDYFCPFPIPLQRGMQSDLVKELQDALGATPSIYPEQLSTGYYGKLTEEAVNRLQQKYDLPVTGVLDAFTIQRVFPCIRLTVHTPNGGEEWMHGQTYRILWKVEYHPVGAPGAAAARVPGSSFDASYPENITAIGNTVPGYFRSVQIDLVNSAGKRISIGNANLNATNHVWTIPTSIPPDRYYRVRIALMPSLYPQSVNYYNSRVVDWSDNFFAITGPFEPPPPDDGVVNQLKTHARTLLKQTESMIATLQTMLRLLEQL